MKKLLTLLTALSLLSANFVLGQETPSTLSYKVGKYEVVQLMDVQEVTEPGIVLGATKAMIDETMPDGTFTIAINAFLVKTPNANILVDAGLGIRLLDNLKSAGVSPDEIDYILITHMHFDHISGLLKDGNVVFPNAKLYISTPEIGFWTNPTIMNSAPEEHKKAFLDACKVIEVYNSNGGCKNFEPIALEEDPFTPIQAEDVPEALSGISAIAAPGHTPGHTTFLVKSENESLLIWGDLTHVMPIQMPYPEVAVLYDLDSEKAIESRKKILEFVATNKIPVAGMHTAYPAIGKVEVAGKGYTYTPVSKK